jgi:DNA transformation protein and related proteins
VSYNTSVARVDPFHEYVMNEVLNQMPGITSRAMFGGWGFYQDGLFFSLIAQDRLYFKVDESNKKDFEDAGSGPFVYDMPNGKTTTMNYYEVPETIMESRDEIADWVEKAVEVARKAKQK